jgi:hypothetical protein
MGEHKELAKMLIEWLDDPAHYSVVHFAIEHGLSKEALLRMADEDEELGKALEYGWSVQEYKVAEGALTNALNRSVALKMLETYAGWKADVNIVQNNEYKQYMAQARKKAEEILGDTPKRIVDFGEDLPTGGDDE